jgi:NADH-quinone oxidoreductase subunit L
MTMVWLCWLIPVLGALLVPVLARIDRRLRDYAGVAFCLLAALTAASMLPGALAGERVWHQVEWMPQFGIDAGVLADPLSVFMANVVSWLSFLIAVYSLGYMHGEEGVTRYWSLFNLFVGGMLLLVLSDNLLQMFIGWEVVGVCSYSLIGFWHRDENEHWVGSPPNAYPPTHAAMKAFLFTKAGDICLLMAIFVIYHVAGTLSFVELSQDTGWMAQLADLRLLVPVALLLFGGPLGKSAQFPLHEWLPEAMAGPTPVSALIHAAAMVKAGVYLVARMAPILLSSHQPGISAFFTVVAWIGGFTAFMAATQAVVQRELKKVLAYSTISQLGYMFLALGVGGLAADFTGGYMAAVSHLLSHAIFKACLFLAAGSVIHACHTRFMDGMGGLRKAMPITFASMLVAAFSLSGVPPLSGFWSKDAILHACLEAGQYALFGLAALTAGLTFFYSLRMISLTFLGQRHLHEEEIHAVRVHEAPPIMWVPCVILAVATVGLGIANPFIEERFRAYFEPVYGSVAHAARHAADGAGIAVATSLAMLVVGGFAAWYLYVARKASPAQLCRKYPLLGFIRAFLWNRWYVNAFYYRLLRVLIAWSSAAYRRLEKGLIDTAQFELAGSVTRTSQSAFDRFEAGLFDRLQFGLAAGLAKTSQSAYGRVEAGVFDQAQHGLARGLTRLSRQAFKRLEMGIIDRLQRLLARDLVDAGQTYRKTQTGVLSHNMLYVQLGLLILLAIFGAAALWRW